MSQPQKGGEDLSAVRRVNHLGVELDAVEAAVDVLESGNRRFRRRGQSRETGRRLVDRVAMRHPARLIVRKPGQQPAVLRHLEARAPELADRRALDAPAELEHHRLHAVADAEYRNPKIEELPAQLRRAVRVHRRGPARQDQAARLPAPDLLERHRVRQQLTENAALAHAARDQLRVLAPEVEDEDLVRADGAPLRGSAPRLSERLGHLSRRAHGRNP
jgi:hypothetical protein